MAGTSFFKVTWIDSPNGGHVFSPEKVTAMGPFTRSRLEETGSFKYDLFVYFYPKLPLSRLFFNIGTVAPTTMKIIP